MHCPTARPALSAARDRSPTLRPLPRRANPVTQAELRALLADALALWGVSARVEPEGEGVAIAAGTTRCAVSPALPEARPIRWFVMTSERAAAGRGPRPAASIIGVLGALREALDGQ